MENKVRFRNHFSVVFEKIGALNGVLLFFCISNFDLLAEVAEDGSFENFKSMLLIGGGVLALYLCVAIYHLVIWSKTYVVLMDQNIVLEKNTLHKKKLTIGIKNISNVNIERNLFELLIGTCKVKLDTNSLSTAESTDVSIVLKKKEGEQLKSYILQLMKLADGESPETESANSLEEEAWDYKAELSDILAHGLFSIKGLAVLGTVLGILMTGGCLKNFFFEEEGMKVGALLGGILMSGGVFLSSFGSIIKGFVRYYDFRIARRNQKLYIQYGFFKKMNYTIPVEKINGLIVEQSFIARCAHRYKGTLINIGMGDDSIEEESFLFPYCTEEQMRERIQCLLPELKDELNLDYEKQPRETWLAWGVPFGMLCSLMIGGGLIGNHYYSEYQLWIIGGVLGFLLLAILYMILNFITNGIQLGESYLLLVSGALQRKYCFISCRKIQYLSFSQNPVASAFKLEKGNAFLLASFMYRVQSIPYVKMEKAERLKEKLFI